MRRFDTPPYYLTAYGLAVKNGFRGTEEEWLESLHGEPAELESSVTEYQAGLSGKEVPSGAWSTEVPEVAQGEYLWTRTTVTFDTGEPVMIYSVARMGMDGAKGDKGEKGDRGDKGERGEKGETGDPATMLNWKVEYQASDSGQITPTGAWYSDVPAVDQGKYLWTRTTKTYNTGSPVVSYSVARQGMDGNGAILTVAGKGPGDNGDIELTAEDVGARSNTWVPTAAEVGARPNTWTPTADDVGARPNTWTPTAAEVGARPNTWMPTAAEIGARPDTWMPTAAEVGALSTAGGSVGTIKIKTAGTKETCDIVFSRPDDYEYDAHIDILNNNLRIYRYDRSNAIATVLSLGLADGALTVGDRTLTPTMSAGTEYKLGERWMGNPVYAKLVDFGTLPNSTYKSVSIGVGASKIISVYGFGYNATDGTFMHFPTVHGGAIGAACFVNASGGLVVETYRDMSAWTGKFIVKYTK